VKLGQDCFIVRDANSQALAYAYFEDKTGRRAAAHLLTRDEARRVAANIAKPPELLTSVGPAKASPTNRRWCAKSERSAMSSGKLVEQRLCLLQIARVKSLGEPAVDRSEKLARLIPLALIAPEARHAHRGAEFPGFGVLRAGD
jgi:hypothetical protein